MNTNGVMEEVRGLLSQGTSSSEAIALGYKPSTVYKAQRQLRKVLSASEPPVTTQVLVTNMASEDCTKLREENNSLRESLSSLEEVMAQEVRQWQAGLQQEQVARKEAEELVSNRNSEIDQLRAENQRLTQTLEDLPSKIVPKVWEQIQPLQQETEELWLLKVWVGHPCSGCGKPTSGIPSREVAAKLLRDGGYGHGDCVKKKSWW